MFKLNLACDESIKSIISTDTYTVSGMDFGAALSDDDVAGGNELTVSSLNAKTLGLGITTVLGRTNALLVGEELQTKL